ncbi:glycosyl transferase [Echinicola strongylocentroti]|uniref:Glycosyl transferase n=1 Tax=Echinicola strongylocentroti TaxID=1795355 RepID=A0A2Z4IG33_9BACT|nr:glycosyltransferase [Echinicola strongylocentroti]AWW29855.1 glycosyl transferase [Echinicola strongylocentroti]
MHHTKDELKATLIISVYKNTTFLKAVLDSLEGQTDHRFEVIISEDGDSEEMRTFVGHYSFQDPFQHLTREDRGWQKNQALNAAIRAANTDWLVFIDGDCVLHPRFMEFHINHANPTTILAGKRVKLDPKTSELLLEGSIKPEEMNAYVRKHFAKIKKRGGEFVEEGFFMDPKGVLGRIVGTRKMRHLKGCNMSFHKDAIYAINGFDEAYTRPAVGEDADLLWRFKGLGYQLGSVRNLAVQYHLYHKESWTDQEENLRIMNENMAAKKYVCSDGLVKES